MRMLHWLLMRGRAAQLMAAAGMSAAMTEKRSGTRNGSSVSLGGESVRRQHDYWVGKDRREQLQFQCAVHKYRICRLYSRLLTCVALSLPVDGYKCVRL